MKSWPAQTAPWMASSWLEGTLARGFTFPAGKLVVLSAAELFGRFPTHGRRRLQRAEKLARNRAQIDFSELNEGDLVVHLEHGVGRFLELMKVPACRAAECRKCSPSSLPRTRNSMSRSSRPILFRVTSASAKKSRRSVRSPMQMGARERRTPPRRSSITRARCCAFRRSARRSTATHSAPDTKWQGEFEHSFPFRGNGRSAQGDRRDEARTWNRRARWIG